MVALCFVLACLTSVGSCLRTLSSAPPSVGTSWSLLRSAGQSTGHISNSSKVLSTFLLASRLGVPLNFAARGLSSGRATSTFPRLQQNPTISRHAWNLNRRAPFAGRARWIGIPKSADKDLAPGSARDVGMNDQTSNGATPQSSDKGSLGMEISGDLGLKNGAAHDEAGIQHRRGRELPIHQVQRYTSSNWKQVVLSTPQSDVLKRISGPILANIVWAAIVWGAFQFFSFPAKFFTQAHSLVGSALGLLLVFRTKAAYQRFEEGSMILEKLLGYVRVLADMSMMYKSAMPKGKAKRIASLMCAFSCLLAEHLGYSDIEKFPCERFLTQGDRTELQRYFNRPLWAINTLGRELREIPDLKVDGQTLFSGEERLRMISLVDKMSDALGKSERLVQTPVPLNYARHTARCLAIWCFSLPFALAGGLGMAIVPVMGLVSWVMYGIQEIGIMIEDPFRKSLRLDSFLQSIYSDVFETNKMAKI